MIECSKSRWKDVNCSTISDIMRYKQWCVRSVNLIEGVPLELKVGCVGGTSEGFMRETEEDFHSREGYRLQWTISPLSTSRNNTNYTELSLVATVATDVTDAIDAPIASASDFPPYSNRNNELEDWWESGLKSMILPMLSSNRSQISITI